jgi:hypothetical protein
VSIQIGEFVACQGPVGIGPSRVNDIGEGVFPVRNRGFIVATKVDVDGGVSIGRGEVVPVNGMEEGEVWRVILTEPVRRRVIRSRA